MKILTKNPSHSFNLIIGLLYESYKFNTSIANLTLIKYKEDIFTSNYSK